MADHACIVLTTCSSREQAEQIAQELLRSRLAACVNILPGISSWYWWQGSISADSEMMLVIKTMDDRVDELQRELPKLHPYQVPELVILPIIGGGQAYLDWIQAETRKADSGEGQRG